MSEHKLRNMLQPGSTLFEAKEREGKRWKGLGWISQYKCALKSYKSSHNTAILQDRLRNGATLVTSMPFMNLAHEDFQVHARQRVAYGALDFAKTPVQLLRLVGSLP